MAQKKHKLGIKDLKPFKKTPPKRAYPAILNKFFVIIKILLLSITCFSDNF